MNLKKKIYFCKKNNIINAISNLHKHKLSSNDVAPWNIIVTYHTSDKMQGGVKFIDLSDDTVYSISKIKDMMEACRYYGFEFSEFGCKKGFIYYYLTYRNKIRKIL